MVDGLAPGAYQAAFLKGGYEGRGRPSRRFEIQSEDERLSLSVTLRRSPVIAGRVLDPWGDPVPQAFVQLRRWLSSQGVRQLQPMQTARTDDLGEYRLFDLRPGPYVLTATPPAAASGPGDVLHDLAPRFHGGADAASASVVNVDWGALAEGLDFQLEPAPATLLVGLARDRDGSACTTCQILLDYDGGLSFGIQPDAEGVFRLRGIPAGAARILARNRAGGVAYLDVVIASDRPSEALIS